MDDVIARCDLKTADRLVQFFKEMWDFPEPEKDDVATAFREMLLNASSTEVISIQPIRRSRLCARAKHGFVQD